VNQTASRRLRLIVPLALYAIFLWRTPYSMQSLPLRMLDWIVPGVGLGAWCILSWRKGKPWPRTFLDWPLLAWLFAGVWATAFSVNPRQSLRGVWEMWTWALILWFFVDAIRARWAPVLWRALYLMGGAVCLLGLVEFLAWYLGWPLLSTFQVSWLDIGGLANPIPPTLHRVGTPLVNITALSAFIALLIPPALSILATARDRDTRLGMLLWLLAATTVELLALSRGGFLALGVSLPLLALGGSRSPAFRRWWANRSPARRRTLLMGSVATVLIASVGTVALLVTRLNDRSTGDAVRLDLWRSALTMLHDHPLTGVGPEAYGTALRTYRDPSQARDHVTKAHSLYLNTGADMGLPGLLAGGWLLGTLAWVWWRRWRAELPGSSAWWRLLGMGAALAGLAAQSCVDTFVEPAVLLPATLFVGLALSPGSMENLPQRPARRWPWIVALSILALGLLAMAWDSRGDIPYARSLAWTRRGNIEKALASAEQARRLDPHMPLYACHAGYLYGLQAAAGRDEALPLAVERYRECVAETAVPGWVDQMNLATLLWHAGKEDEALALRASVPPLTRGLWAEEAGDPAEAIGAYTQALIQAPELAGSPFWRQADRAAWWDEISAGVVEALGQPGRWRLALATEDWDTAAQALKPWLASHPQDTEAMTALAESLVGLGRPQDALVWLDRAISQAPASAPAYVIRAEAELMLGRHDRADKDLRTALFIEPGSRAHLGLARLAQREGRDQEALQHYARALRPLVLLQGYNVVLYHRPSWPAPLLQAGGIGYRQDRQVTLEWGTLLEEKGDLAGARSVYEAALRLDPSLTEVRQRLEALGSP
jgi:tetratricopeptide (TPR) repeat protein